MTVDTDRYDFGSPGTQRSDYFDNLFDFSSINIKNNNYNKQTKLNNKIHYIQTMCLFFHYEGEEGQVLRRPLIIS